MSTATSAFRSPEAIVWRCVVLDLLCPTRDRSALWRLSMISTSNGNVIRSERDSLTRRKSVWTRPLWRPRSPWHWLKRRSSGWRRALATRLPLGNDGWTEKHHGYSRTKCRSLTSKAICWRTRAILFSSLMLWNVRFSSRWFNRRLPGGTLKYSGNDEWTKLLPSNEFRRVSWLVHRHGN